MSLTFRSCYFVSGKRTPSNEAWNEPRCRLEEVEGKAYDLDEWGHAVDASIRRASLLLTGDIEASAERRLVQGDAPVGAEVALVPHHGSVTSSSAGTSPLPFRAVRSTL